MKHLWNFLDGYWFIRCFVLLIIVPICAGLRFMHKFLGPWLLPAVIALALSVEIGLRIYGRSRQGGDFAADGDAGPFEDETGSTER